MDIVCGQTVALIQRENWFRGDLEAWLQAANTTE